ncbi:MAG: glycerophosphodiester phosphodiesterase [Fluviicoccus sp.]|uniref:glycerophosphodiester phosphodiesterase n=1 Tax=Fluviicoccus sp. TaxID=2003552 RepID=UPI00272714F2|nr:glycerophosphodiester phosphodiesterase [Fluviicoccus sp.]MDO8330370.1 glycerophosphodiester phosphodiesterase [Fluviicoccus sp.]
MEILGHRGARGEAPENTLSGFRHLRDLGIRAVEFDIQVAGDGELMVIHDDRVDRTTAATGRLREFTVTQLNRMDACQHRRFLSADGLEYDWPCHDGIPSLRDVLALLADFSHLQLEVKAQSPEDVAQVIQRLPELWQPFGHHAVTTSFNSRYLQGIREAAPEIPRGLLVESDFRGDLVQHAVDLGCISIGPHFSLCTAELVADAHQAGLTVSTWTVNEADDMLRLRDLGVDSIITDYPQKALQVLA